MLDSTQKEFLENQLKSSIKNSKPLYGGDINDVYLIETENQSLVLKTNAKTLFPKMLEKEYCALEFLNSKSPIHYPKPIAHFTDEKNQYLLMEYIEPGANTKKGEINLGRELALQHQISNETFGWKEDNFIGSLPQINTKTNDWSNFYAEHRLLFQTKMAFDNGIIQSSAVKQMERFCNHLPEIFPKEKPSLLHGDLWSGNYFIDKTNQPILYDPAVYFGHREIDIAMTRLFGGFSEDFYLSYNETNVLENDWQKRIPFGQLYPNLVHLNLFGGGYLSSISNVIKHF